MVVKSFGKMERMILKAVYAHLRRYGGSFEELYSDAVSIYYDIRATYSPERGAFTTWLTYKLRLELVELLRRKVSHHNRFPTFYSDFRANAQPIQPQPFWYEDFLFGLSEDAKYIARLALRSPLSIELGIIERCGKERPTRRSMRSSIREFLMDKGWTANRVAESFEEIGQALRA